MIRMKIVFIIIVGLMPIFTFASENNNLQIPKSVMETGSLSIFEFGAVGDGKTANTSYIQKAIDTVSNAGGGTIIIPAGKYLTGTIQLKDNVFLYLTPGSVLIGSTNIEDYPELKVSYRSYTDNYSQRTLIFAEKQQNIGIFGYGKIY
ncbi:MAG TPA: glycosyl hydrolase family 28-related protein, partial [Candidatus Hydrogenedens sp.]|nr:glycosyl hydrolase family 28-related protein [Candidatus Hydrogenedens sp.]